MPRPLSAPGLAPFVSTPDVLPVLVEDYLAYNKHQRGLSPLSYLHYQSWLRLFLKWLEAQGHPLTLASFTTPILRSYLYASSQVGKRPRTILSAFNPMWGIAPYLVENGLIPTDPTKALKFPKKDAANR